MMMVMMIIILIVLSCATDNKDNDYDDNFYLSAELIFGATAATSGGVKNFDSCVVA